MSRLSRRDRRASILHAARRALAKRGFLGTRAEDIARAAGVSAGLLFRYFPTLADLQRAAVAQGLKQPPMRWPKNLSGMRPRMACKAVAAAFREAVDRDPDALRLACFGALTEVPDSALLVRRDLLRVERKLGSVLRTWKAKKWIVSEVDATGLSRVIVSALVQDVVSGQLFGIRSGGKRLDRIIDAVAGLLEGSVRAVVRDPSSARWRAV
jgi:AcrR family transcriptional regulator